MSRSDAPLIGVTGPDHGGNTAWVFTWLAVRRAGGRAVRITPGRPRALDGLVLGGGADVADSLPVVADIGEPVESSRFGHWVRWAVDSLVVVLMVIARRLLFFGRESPGGDPERDELEARLLRGAMERDLPVLGICRGSQLMALMAGGALVRDVAEHHERWVSMWTPLPRRDVVVEAGTRLREVCGQDRLVVNSLHHDAVARVDPPARACAYEPVNQIVYAIDDPSHSFWIGVQWHPEYMPQVEVHQRLFHALVRAARHHHPAIDHTGHDLECEPEPSAHCRPRAGAPASIPSDGSPCQSR